MINGRKTPTWPRYEIMAGFVVASLLLVLLAFVLAHTLLRNIQPSPEAIEAVRRTLVPDLREDLKPEPLERWLFILLTLASPFLVWLGLCVARLIPGWFSGREATNSKPGVALGGVSLLVGALGIYLLHGGSLFQYFVFPVSSIVDLAIVYGAGALLFLVVWRKVFANSMALEGSKSRCAWRFLVVALAFAVSMLPRGFSIRSILSTKDISIYAWDVHFQAVAYSLSQVYAGKPLLTAAPPLYGNYSEFLLPVFKVIGLSMFKFCVVMALIEFVALASVLLIAVSHLKNLIVRLLCCSALVYFLGSTCLVGRRPFDPVYQYWPIRFIFPALSVAIYLWVARRNTVAAWLGLGVFSGLALMWNLDSGIAVAGTVMVALVGEAIFGMFGRRNNRASGLFPFIALAITACAMLATAALFWLFLQIQADWKPPFHRTADYQMLFYRAGLMMEPMPLSAHPWWLVIAAYLLGLGFSGRRILKGNRDTLTRLCLFLSILGAGLFTYYQGRSVDFNLMNASWPAILLGFIFADRLLRAIRAGLFPRGICWITLPAVYPGMMALAMLPVTCAHIWSFGAEQWRLALMGLPAAGSEDAESILNRRADIVSRRVDFIRANVGHDSDCVILADLQAVYFMETGFRSSLDAPGLTEIYFMQDLDKLRAELLANPPRHLFVDQATLETLQLTDAVAGRYQTVATFPDGKLVYMEPRMR